MLWRLYRGAEERLTGWPSTALTLLLLLAAVAIVCIALRGSPMVKAATAVFVILP